MPTGQDYLPAPARPGSFGFPVVSLFSTQGDARLTVGSSVLVIAFFFCLILEGGGFALAGPAPTIIACSAILLAGLPHGTLDLTIIRREREAGLTKMAVLLLCYLGLAGMMAALWYVAPIAALAMFVFVSVIHFAEDWFETGSVFLAQGMAIALLSAPTLFHFATIEQLFVALAGHGGAGVVADVLLLLAPTAMAVALVAIVALWRTGRRDQAIVGAVTLGAMVLLPPVIGFALFFCLYHSPRHLRGALVRSIGVKRPRRTIVLLTLAALGIAATVFAGAARADLPAQFVAASFMTLSILTVPHMIVPAIVEALTTLRAGTRRRIIPAARADLQSPADGRV